jgi:hypothetical protein
MSHEDGLFANSGATKKAKQRIIPALFAFSFALFAPTLASAQQEMLAGQVGAGTGFEAGSPGTGSVDWHRARTRAVVGLDFAVDEPGYNAFGFRSFVELEHRASLGGSFHYTRWIAPKFGLFVGFTGVAAPETLFGGTAGAQFVIPLGKKVGIFIEPELSALPIGSDLPEGSVLIWLLLNAGVRFDI